MDGKFTREHMMERHFKFGKPILEAKVSKVNWVRCYPQTIQTINALPGVPTLFNVTRSGYLPPASVVEAYYEFDITCPAPAYPSAPVSSTSTTTNNYYIEPYASVDRVDQIWNDCNTNSANLRRDLMAVQQLTEGSQNQAFNQGIMAGVPFQSESYPQFATATQSVSNFHPGRNLIKTSSSTTSTSVQSSTGSVTQRYCIPVKLWNDTLLSDKDGLVNLQYMTGVQLFLYCGDPNRWSWFYQTVAVGGGSTTSTAAAAPTMVISNQILHLPIVFVDDQEQDTIVRELLEVGGGLTYATHACYINPQAIPSPLGSATPSVSVGSGQQTITFSSLPPSVRSITTYLEGVPQATSYLCAYKCLAGHPQFGVTSYQYILDGKAVPDLPVRCAVSQPCSTTAFTKPTDTDGYRMLIECAYARKMAFLDHRNMSGMLVDYYTYHNSAYAASNPGATQTNLIGVPSSMFSMPISLSPMNPLLYGGSKFLTFQLQINFDGYGGIYDTAATSTSSLGGLTNAHAITVAWINRVISLTRNGGLVLV